MPIVNFALKFQVTLSTPMNLILSTYSQAIFRFDPPGPGRGGFGGGNFGGGFGGGGFGGFMQILQTLCSWAIPGFVDDFQLSKAHDGELFMAVRTRKLS